MTYNAFSPYPIHEACKTNAFLTGSVKYDALSNKTATRIDAYIGLPWAYLLNISSNLHINTTTGGDILCSHLAFNNRQVHNIHPFKKSMNILTCFINIYKHTDEKYYSNFPTKPTIR